MDKKILVEKNIEEGKILVQELDSTKFKLTGAFWFLFSVPEEHAGWRLILVSPSFDKIGPRKSYSYLQEVIQRLQLSSISLLNINIQNTKAFLVELLRMAIKTSPESISEIRFSENTINNIFIEDALVYRLL